MVILVKVLLVVQVKVVIQITIKFEMMVYQSKGSWVKQIKVVIQITMTMPVKVHQLIDQRTWPRSAVITALYYSQVTTHFKFFWHSTLIYTNQSGYASGTAEEIAIPSKQSNKLQPTRACKRRH